jgi:pantoate--beta-alanine ligase
MIVYNDRDSLSKALLPFRQHKKIGLIPTMGALHNGHLTIIKQALEDNDCVVVSIFVNPTQFDKKADLIKYPRNLDLDVKLISKLEGTILIYAPEALKLYSGNITSKNYSFGNIENEMEGKYRKGHFNGVGTVVNLLLRAVLPDYAYFGEKDFQQLQIVRKLVEIENLSVEIVGCSIVREKSGIAMSSRNKRLSPAQFEAAVVINKTLLEVKQKFDSLSISKLNELVKDQFLKNEHLKLEYFEVANVKTLKTAKNKFKNNDYRAFIAVFAGKVRLIDNMALS